MRFILSRDALNLLVRLFFVIFALGSVYGIYDNREFLTRFPFYFLALADAAFALVFFYFFITFNTLGRVKGKIAFLSALIYGAYVVVVNLMGFWLFATNLGLENLANEAGLSVSVYVTQQIVYLGMAPAAVFLALAWLVRNLR